MERGASSAAQLPILSQQLLLGVAEELKLPLLQIARLSENLETSEPPDNLNLIQIAADTALKLLDNYALGVRLILEGQSLNREAVSVSSVLYDAAQQLDKMAKSYNVSIDMNIAGKYGPVLANRAGLQAALVSLGAALIEALPALNESSLRLQLATHRSRYGVVAGVYANTKQITSQVLKQGRKLQLSRQPMPNVTHANGAGVFIADSILKAMNLNLTASRHHNLYGLGTVLQPHHQLQLVS